MDDVGDHAPDMGLVTVQRYRSETRVAGGQVGALPNPFQSLDGQLAIHGDDDHTAGLSLEAAIHYQVNVVID
jgi:hypothetical protein